MPILQNSSNKIVGNTPYDSSIGAGISDSSIIAGLKYIISFVDSNAKAGIKVANMSFGKYQRSETVSILVTALSKVNGGTLLVAAASNDDSMAMAYPAAMTEAVAVASVDGASGNELNVKSTFSNFGKWVSISAYGANINSTVPGGGYFETNGTSQASPMVAGVAGLVVALENGNISQGALKTRLLSTANPAPYSVAANSTYYQNIDGATAKVPLLGAGVVDANAAVANTASDGSITIADEIRVSSAGCSSIDKKTGAKPKVSLYCFYCYLFYF